MPNQATFRGRPSITGIREWLQRLGHTDSAINKLNVIYIAGTKGKGSTCAFVNSFLRAHQKRTGYPQKIGLYTSPHLKVIQERIQINSRPLEEDQFARYVFEVWNGLSSMSDPSQGPRYLQLLFLTSVHAFIRERVDVAIYETHNGGEFDATNIFSQPAATGIATIGMDHLAQLGPTIENIAWHKAGIFRKGSPAFSTRQIPAAATVLERRAAEKETTLEFIDIDLIIPADAATLETDVQKLNSSLALALTNAFLQQRAPSAYGGLTPEDIKSGVEEFFWPGRFHQIDEGNHQWFLDGAHNDLSILKAAQWFSAISTRTQSNTAPLIRVLIFSHISDRDGASMLKIIAETLRDYDIGMQYVILSTYKEKLDDQLRPDLCIKPPETLSAENESDYIHAWKSVDPHVEISVEPTIEGALSLARKLGDRGCGAQTLITG
ncbi:hypothetical protein MMC25_007894, partial [Agyrium rufum]|nr:hypothetical protein [Agyrium rufum]